MTRFFVRPEQISNGTVTLGSDDAAHLAKVLRAKIGDEIAVLDGSGTQSIARIVEIDRARAEARVMRTERVDSEPSVAVTIAQSLPKTDEKLEWVLQHGVEIGAAGFVLFRSKRSEAGKLAERPERWQKIVKAAAEQSGRAKMPTISLAAGTNGALAILRACDSILLCDEAEEARSLRSALAAPAPRSIAVLIGPEGGWAPDERASALAAGATAITLGRRILRTETAALTALSRILYALDAD